jgi:hypothetical protein
MFDKEQGHITKEDGQMMIPGLSALQYLEIVCSHSPVVARTIKKYGDASLADYLKMLAPDSGPSFQQRADLGDVVYRYAAPLLGESVARKASQDLTVSPVVLTANHHGVDFFAQSVQGSLFFSLHKRDGNASGTTVPIFSCGNVPLDNLTYPLGLLIYHVYADELGSIPKKMPVFSNRFRRTLVSVSVPLEKTMVKKVESRVDQMVQEKKIAPELKTHLHRIFREDYLSPAVIELPSYSLQSVLLNNRIWKRLFREPLAAPEMVYLELEKIVHMLLESDLLNPESLAWCVMFDSELREAVFRELDSTKLCWSLKKLAQRLHIDRLDSAKKKALNNCGTLFFWGINPSGRRVPLYLETNGKHGEMLRGVDDRGKLWELPYTSQSILNALNQNHLLPSLFTCFLVLSFARGITCVGGYFQCEYLPMMQEGLVKALQKTSGYHDVATLVQGVTTETYLSGMQAVMVRIDEDTLVPAGPIEIIAGGGLTDDNIQQILSLTVRDAHLASLFETVPDIVPWAIKMPDWKKQLAIDCCRILRGSVVIK